MAEVRSKEAHGTEVMTGIVTKTTKVALALAG